MPNVNKALQPPRQLGPRSRNYWPGGAFTPHRSTWRRRRGTKATRRVLELLESQRPKLGQPDLRTFEWYYLWRRCHADCRLSLELGRPPEYSAVALAPDGKTLAAQYGKSDIKLWDVTSGREKLTLKGRERTVWSLAFSPDGQTLASGSEGPGDLILWDISSGKAMKTIESGQNGLRSLGFAPDGRTLASGGGTAPSSCGTWPRDAKKARSTVIPMASYP